MKTVFTLIFASSMFLLKSQNMYVYLGEYDQTHLSIRIDGDGELYPDFNVPENQGCNIGTVDRSFVSYMLDEDCPIRSQILGKCGISTNLKFEEIQQILVKKKIDQINAELVNQKIDNVTFIMVGYNNHYSINSSDDKSANAKLKSLADKITGHLNKNNKKTLIVELYWDGTESEVNGIYSALHFSNSSVNSFWAGIELRKIINGLNCQRVQMISHSMGANIITESIFNQTSKIHPKFEKELSQYTDTIPVPKKTISVGLIAPAIPGVSTFTDYINPKINNNSNCTFIIGYNTNDKTLKKQFGPLQANPTHFSSTSLGCSENEVKSVEELFKTNQGRGTFKPLNFSMYENQPQTVHDLTVYMKEPQYNNMLDLLFGIKQ